MNEDPPLATYEFRRGRLAGSHLALFASMLVHRNADGFEAIQIAQISAVGVRFERDPSRVTWGSVLLIVAALMLLSFLPLRMLIGPALAEAISQSPGGGFLPTALRVLDSGVALLPYVSAVIALWAVAWLFIGWMGETVMRVVITPAERVFAARGRDSLLREFAEAVTARLGIRR
jgi:hypothetical protein